MFYKSKNPVKSESKIFKLTFILNDNRLKSLFAICRWHFEHWEILLSDSRLVRIRSHEFAQPKAKNQDRENCPDHNAGNTGSRYLNFVALVSLENE